MVQRKDQLTIAASFTADQISDAVGFWRDYFVQSTELYLAPYGQVLQQLYDPAGELHRNATGANVVCFRWSDLVGSAPNRAAYLNAAHELATAACGAGEKSPLLLLICPERVDRANAKAASDALRARIASRHMISIDDVSAAFERYRVTDAFDPAADKLGHVPYTQEAMAAIGATIWRWHLALRRSPVKVIAADCDNTLWGGVVGEDGVDGLSLTRGHLALQHELIDQRAKGRLICLLSKNNEADALAVFDQRTDMALTRAHITNHKINWQAKAENVVELADELSLGLDSVVFVDDSTVEVQQMRELAPMVMSVQAPCADELASFCEHMWLFDQPKMTTDDQKRAGRYADEVKRQVAQQSATSLDEFLDSLQLVVDIDAPAPSDMPRMSQMTLRTNQFNASLRRLTEAEVRDKACYLRIIRVRDRFGDYGSVGAMRADVRDDALVADIFLLSCRALGRGVEIEMLRALARHAVALGLSHVGVSFEKGPRNQPGEAFLLRAAERSESVLASGVVLLDAHAALKLTRQNFADASKSAGKRSDHDAHSATLSTAPAVAGQLPAGVRLDEKYQEIAERFRTGADIVAAMKPERRARPDLINDYVAPSTPLQRKIVEIWEDVIGVQGVGVRDPFLALGGKSIQLVQVHGLLAKVTGQAFDLTVLFEHATIETLATYFEGAMSSATHEAENGESAEDVKSAAETRAERMRTARRKQTARRPQKAMN